MNFSEYFAQVFLLEKVLKLRNSIAEDSLGLRAVDFKYTNCKFFRRFG